MTEYHRADIAYPELKELADAVDDEPADRLARSMVRTDQAGQTRYLKRYREIAEGDPIQESWDANEAEFHAKTKIFSVLADAFEAELGKEEGRAAVNRARRRQANEMGKTMAERVRAEGKPLNLNNLFEQFWAYFQWSPKIDTERYYDEHGNMVKYVLRLNCPIGDYLRDNAPDTEYSSNFCDLDEYIACEYNPNIRYSRRHWAPNGDQYSELIWELDTEDIIE
jgi:hypothetical protein